ncbi:hypothetical protein KR200_009776, partial [Drosophila serrata]
MQLIQLNLNHCRAAQDLLTQTVREVGADVAIISEPYRVREGGVWAKDRSGKAALWLCGDGLRQMSNILAADGFVRAEIGGYHIYSCYLAPSLPLEAYSRILEDLSSDLCGRANVIVGGDFNAWAQEWAGAASVIDLTFVSRAISHYAKWEVSDVYTGSDHEAILCSVGVPVVGTRSALRPEKAYRPDTLCIRTFTNVLDGMVTGEPRGADGMANHVAAALEHACDQSMRLRGSFRGSRRPVFWWSDEIADLRSTCHRARRQLTRARGSPRALECSEAFKIARKALKV